MDADFGPVAKRRGLTSPGEGDADLELAAPGEPVYRAVTANSRPSFRSRWSLTVEMPSGVSTSTRPCLWVWLNAIPGEISSPPLDSSSAPRSTRPRESACNATRSSPELTSPPLSPDLAADAFVGAAVAGPAILTAAPPCWASSAAMRFSSLAITSSRCRKAVWRSSVVTDWASAGVAIAAAAPTAMAKTVRVMVHPRFGRWRSRCAPPGGPETQIVRQAPPCGWAPAAPQGRRR